MAGNLQCDEQEKYAPKNPLSSKLVIQNRREKGAEGVLEQIIAENFSNLGKETCIEIQELQRTPFRHNLNRSSARHIIMKLAKYKDKNSESG